MFGFNASKSLRRSFARCISFVYHLFMARIGSRFFWSMYVRSLSRRSILKTTQSKWFADRESMFWEKARKKRPNDGFAGDFRMVGTRFSMIITEIAYNSQLALYIMQDLVTIVLLLELAIGSSRVFFGHSWNCMVFWIWDFWVRKHQKCWVLGRWEVPSGSPVLTKIPNQSCPFRSKAPESGKGSDDDHYCH